MLIVFLFFEKTQSKVSIKLIPIVFWQYIQKFGIFNNIEYLSSVIEHVRISDSAKFIKAIN
jgi:hypothetical protein